MRKTAFQHRGRVAVGDADERPGGRSIAPRPPPKPRRPPRASATRTTADGSKNQSTASVAQNATPSHATAAAQPSSQTYWRMRRRSAPSTVSTAGASVGRSSSSYVDMDRIDSCVLRSASGPSITPFYANFTSRRISHSKHSRPHNAIIIQRSQVSSHWGFGATGRMTVLVRSFNWSHQRVGAVRRQSRAASPT